MKLNTTLALQAGAFVIFLAGILTTISALRQNAITRVRIQQKLETLSQLSAFQQNHDRHQQAMRVFEAASNSVPVVLASLASATVTNARPEIRERETRPLAESWMLKQMEVVFSEINLSQLPDLLLAAEGQQPPWRLVECTLTSSRQADGLARAVLILEAVEKGGNVAKKQTPNSP